MEARFGGKSSIYGPVVTEFNSVGKRTLEWDLNDWKWNGDLFLATPLNPSPSDCTSRQLFPLSPEITANVTLSNSSSSSVEEINPSAEKWKREQEKRRRIEVFPEELNDEAGSLNLKLGEPVYRVVDGEDKVEMKSGKKSKVGGSTGNHPVCQVEDCRADLSNAKDYHRRHKVCETHSKASKALVGNVMQRFCQQCSRFHVLQEFDDGKRSCRRRLAGHNKRRRKTHPETSVDVGSLTDEKNASYLLVTLLRILSNLHANGSSESKDQDLLLHLLRNLGGLVNGNNISALMQGTHCLPNVETRMPEKDPSNTQGLALALPSNKGHLQERVPCPTKSYMPHKGNAQVANVQRYTACSFDLNDAYDESQDCIGDQEHGHASPPSSFWAEQDLQKSSPPQNSGNSDLTSNRSSSSGSEEQCCTDRIVFKLFGKSPNDLPHVLRSQILEWLSHSPTDIEGYIRPGCIVLTIYLRLNKCLWEEFYCDMNSSLSRLLNVSDDPFWKTGWIYTRVRQHAAFICDGRVILDTPLPVKNRRSRILSISPLAVPASETVQLVVRGSNLALSTSRLLCAIEGSYLVQESCHVLEGADTATEQDEVQCLSFSCSIPDVNGRGFIEVEDYGLTGCFFPFIVAEPEICSEICTLEKVIEVVSPNDFDDDEECDTTDVRNQALDFIHEMGWLLHRNQLRFKPSHNNPSLDLFPFGRLKWLIEFTVDHEWAAVLRKLLDLMFSGIVDAREYTSVEHALMEMSLLHEAVRKSSRPIIEFLLTYVPKKVKNTSNRDDRQLVDGSQGDFLFRPDMPGVGGLTPLHVAASIKGSENVLDALLEDPGMVGIKAWKNSRDSTGLTPDDYASLRGHHSYINLAEQKINRKTSNMHVVVDIPSPSSLKSNQNHIGKLSSAKVDSFYTEKSNNFQLGTSCRLCDINFDYGYRRSALTFRPAVFSLVAIAAVCVCTALLFKSLPRVFGSFNWESLEYGTI